MSTSEEQERIFGRFVEWLTQNGGKVNSLQLKYEAGSDERGVFLTNDLKARATILKLPLDCLLTSNIAKRDTQVARNLWKNNPKFREPNLIALVVHLLATRNDETHFFKPFYDTLPKDVRHFPIFWNEEQLAWLTGSTAIGILQERNMNLKNDFEKLKSLAPEFFEHITFNEFLEARTLVGSRNFFFKDAALIGMVPFADMLNHSFPSQTEWNYNPKKKIFTMNIVGKGEKGEEIFSSYGAKPNLHYFLYYGFAMENNRAMIPKAKKLVPMNRVMNLKLEYPKSDALARKRMAVLEKCIVKLMKFKKRRQSKIAFAEMVKDVDDKDVEMKGVQGEVATKEFKYYSLAMHYHPGRREDAAKEVLNFFRVKFASEAQLDVLVKELTDFNPKDKEHIEPSLFIDAHNEADALEGLAKFCADQLKSYPDSYKNNLEKLKDPEIRKDKLHRLALIVVTGEQEIYNFWREIAHICAPILRKFGVDATDKLMAALSALPQETQFEQDLHEVASEIAQNIKENLS